MEREDGNTSFSRSKTVKAVKAKECNGCKPNDAVEDLEGRSTTQLKCIISLFVCLIFFAVGIAIGAFFLHYHWHPDLPQGAIIPWKQNKADQLPPKGWCLCDGSNNAPNLTDKFLIGEEFEAKFIYNTTADWNGNCPKKTVCLSDYTYKVVYIMKC